MPQYTYVDRAKLDKKFNYLWDSQKHIVIHGASKQGKSCIRKKNIEDSDIIVVHCLPNMTSDDIWIEGLNLLGVQIPEKIVEKIGEEASDGVTGKVKGGFPGIVKGVVEGNSVNLKSKEIDKTFVTAHGYGESVKFLAKQLIHADKRLIIEDFHYLSEETRQEIAFHLKVLFESNVFVLLIGIWAEQNLLAYYNGDLIGRIEEINIGWTNEDLCDVLKKGEEALNISFSEKIKNEIIESSYENVGLLQRIAENICYIEGTYDKQSKTTVIDNIESLESAREKIVSDISQRYTKIKEVFERGFKTSTELKVYYQIFKFLIEAKDEDLINGIHQAEVLKHIQTYSHKEIRPGDLTSALDKIERLQSSKKITPLLMSYNKSLREISLTDREFLFYRKYGNIKWEWLEDENVASQRNVNISFTQIEIIQTNENTAELNHSTLGNKTISKNDENLIKIYDELGSKKIDYSISKRMLIGHDPIENLEFYLGFLYKKEYIDYLPIDEDLIAISKKTRSYSNI